MSVRKRERKKREIASKKDKEREKKRKKVRTKEIRKNARDRKTVFTITSKRLYTMCTAKSIVTLLKSQSQN